MFPSFPLFFFVSRTLWVVLGSGMGWRVPLLPCLVQILTQLWDPGVPKYQIDIFINVPFTEVGKWLQHDSLRGLVTLLQLEKQQLSWSWAAHTGPFLLSEDKAITPWLWKPLAADRFVFAEGWPSQGAAAAIPSEPAGQSWAAKPFQKSALAPICRICWEIKVFFWSFPAPFRICGRSKPISIPRAVGREAARWGCLWLLMYTLLRLSSSANSNKLCY